MVSKPHSLSWELFWELIALPAGYAFTNRVYSPAVMVTWCKVQDPRFLEALRACADDHALAQLVGHFLRDRTPCLRQQLLADRPTLVGWYVSYIDMTDPALAARFRAERAALPS